MAGQFSERAALIAYIRERWPNLGRADVEELAQEALTRALEGNGAPTGADLLEKATEELRTIGKEAFWQKKRSIPSANIETDAGVPLKEVRQTARRVGARRPKGVTSFHAADTGYHVIECLVGSPPTNEARLAAYLLRTRVLESIEAMEHVPAETVEKTLKAFEQIFQHRPSGVWANVLIEQVAIAKRAEISLVEEKRAPALPESGSTATGYDPKDKRKKAKTFAIRTQLLSVRGTRAIVGVFSDLGLGQGEQLLGEVAGTLGGRSIDYPRDPRDRALLVLTIATGILASLPVTCTIPEYAFDAELICWLEMRMGFQGGGGRHSMTKDRLLDLLLDPEELANAIEAHGKRLAERSDERTAQQLEDGLTRLGARVRERSRATAATG